MTFYIAERNKETGKFELWMNENKLNEMYNESEALEMYEMVLKLQGQKNVLLLEDVRLDVELKVSRYVPGDTE